MSSALQQAILTHDRAQAETELSELENSQQWSLITFIDEFLPLLLMETNLRYKNFHLVKMSLFLRRLTMEHYFSKATEYALLRLVSQELLTRSWLRIEAAPLGWLEQAESSTMQNFLQEMGEHNVHNAFHYALKIWKKDPDILFQTLLLSGSAFISDTLGHSLSCFFPVVEDLMAANHPHATTGLLSYLMYLVRYGISDDLVQKIAQKSEKPQDYVTLLKRCASGSGIVNIHHTITLYIFTAWEEAKFNAERQVPYSLLLEWLDEKKVDQERERRVGPSLHADDLPHTYQEFAELFSFEHLDHTIATIFMLLEIFPQRTVDWLFRIYASYYTPQNWNPHYYTSLYAALCLFLGEKIHDEIACRMAIDQAVRYFAEGITKEH